MVAKPFEGELPPGSVASAEGAEQIDEEHSGELETGGELVEK